MNEWMMRKRQQAEVLMKVPSKQGTTYAMAQRKVNLKRSSIEYSIHSKNFSSYYYIMSSSYIEKQMI